MERETVEQVRFEESDQFKINVVYPLLAHQIVKMKKPQRLVTMHLGVGSGLEIAGVDGALIRYSILVDKNPKILEVASNRFKGKNIESESLVSDLAHGLPIEAESVDIVIALFLLNQIKDFQMVIDDSARCLKKTGKIFIAVPNEEFISFCSNSRPDRLSELVIDVSKRQLVKYIFSGVDLKTDLYVRPNNDYSEGVKQAGLNLTLFEDVMDPIDDFIGNVPKGLLVIGEKI